MNEAQRQFYLKHCGITLWYSQTALAGAAPSITFEFPDEDTEGGADSLEHSPDWAEKRRVRQPDSPIASETARVTGGRTAPAHQARPAVEVDSASPVDWPANSELSPPASTVNTDASGRTRFAVDLRIASAGKLVLMAQAGGDLPVDLQDKLLMQISRALGQPVAADRLSDLVWPVFANRDVPGNDDAGLSIVLKHVLGPLRSRTWVGLGSDVKELMALADEGESDTGPRLAFAHGLNELAVSAGFKRQLWHLVCDTTILAQLSEEPVETSSL